MASSMKMFTPLDMEYGPIKLSAISNSELRKLAEFLSLQSRAPATAKKYAGGISQWKKWTSTKSEVVPLVAKPVHVAMSKVKVCIPCRESFVIWTHILACVEHVTQDPLKLTEEILDGAQIYYVGSQR